MTINLVVDSTADLGAEYSKAHNITVVAQQITIGDESYRDGIDIKPEDIYKTMRTSNVVPKTAMSSPADFAEAFQKASAGGDTAICVTVSGGLSGTYGSAVTAREQLPDRDIRVVDSRAITMGAGLEIHEAVNCIEAGGSADDAIAAMAKVRETMRLVFVPESLEYLKRGGRIGNAQAFLGSVLAIKPVLELKDGKIEPLEKVRTWSKALEHLVGETRTASNGGSTKLKATVAHADNRKDADWVAEQIAPYLVEPAGMVELGPVVGVHGGPGIVGVAFFKP